MARNLYVAYAKHKKTIFKEKLVLPVVDSIIINEGQYDHVYLLFGSLNAAELVQSKTVDESWSVIKILKNQIKAGWPRWCDIKFLINLYRPERNSNTAYLVSKNRWLFFAFRNYLVARYYSVEFSDYAKNCEQARVFAYYCGRMLGVVMAFRKNGKPVYDIQHGYIGQSHPAYNNAKLINTGSFFEPSGYIMWNERFAYKGSPLLSKEIVFTNYAHIRVFAGKSTRLSLARRVLFASQWGTPLPKFLKKIIPLYQQVEWIFRLHPFEEERRDDVYNFQQYGNVRVEGAGVPLAQEIMECGLVMTVDSSVIHEAAVLGVKSLFTSPIGLERFALEIRDGLAECVDSVTVEQVFKSHFNLL